MLPSPLRVKDKVGSPFSLQIIYEILKSIHSFLSRLVESGGRFFDNSSNIDFRLLISTSRHGDGKLTLYLAVSCPPHTVANVYEEILGLYAPISQL